MHPFLLISLLSLLVLETVHATIPFPPLALWTLQEETGVPRLSSGSAGPYALVDGNASSPIEGRNVSGGAPFGSVAAYFSGQESVNNSRRLFASRESSPAITSGLAGPTAKVTLVVWVMLEAGKPGNGLVAGVWDEFGTCGGATGARQYALFLSLGACNSAPVYKGGAAAHISPVGGPTPGSPFCETAACDPRELPPGVWHCLTNTYDDADITVYVNGSAIANGPRNPFPLTGGIFDPEASGRFGAEFGVGSNRVNATSDCVPHWDNIFTGYIGGIAIYNDSLTASGVQEACALPSMMREKRGE